MKDEIKEILFIEEQNADYKRLSIDELVILKDYITNLQKENNNLKEDFKRHIDRINELTKRSDNLQEENINIKQQLLENKISLKDVEYQEKLKYKSRIDKTIKMFNNKTLNKYYGNSYEFAIEDFKEDLLNILQGSDKNE